MTSEEFTEHERRAAMAKLTPEKLDRMLHYMRVRYAFIVSPPKVGLFGSMYRALLGVNFEAEVHAAKVAGVQAYEARVLTPVLMTHFIGVYAAVKFGKAMWDEQARAHCSQEYGAAALTLLTANEAKFVAFVKEQHESIIAVDTA